jgi:hypothetical protein
MHVYDTILRILVTSGVDKDLREFLNYSTIQLLDFSQLNSRRPPFYKLKVH